MIEIELNYIVTTEENNWKVSKILLQRLMISSRLLNKLKMNEKILVNQIPVFSNYLVHTGDYVKVKIDFIEEDFIHPENIELAILYEDDYFLAVSKPSNMVVHPSANHLSHTLANGVKYYLNNQRKIRAINRLDRDTSGIVLFAKNAYIQERMIHESSIKKEYIAIINGRLKEKNGTICKPIRRKNGSIMEREVSEEGQMAITHYQVIQELKIENIWISVLQLQLETRTYPSNKSTFSFYGNSYIRRYFIWKRKQTNFKTSTSCIPYGISSSNYQ